MTKPHEDWFYFADEDLSFAGSGLKDGFYTHVCFLSQQAVEKTMKGFLVFQNRDYPRTHNLTELYQLIKAPWLEEYRGQLNKLSEFYIPVRYPDAMAGTLPKGLPNKEQAALALQWAMEIVGLIKKQTHG